MGTEIDTYMDMDPNEMSKDDIDKIIAYHRKNRMAMEAGEKRPKKEAGPKQKLKLDLASLLGTKAKPAVDPNALIIKRRI